MSLWVKRDDVGSYLFFHSREDVDTADYYFRLGKDNRLFSNWTLGDDDVVEVEIIPKGTTRSTPPTAPTCAALTPEILAVATSLEGLLGFLIECDVKDAYRELGRLEGAVGNLLLLINNAAKATGGAQ